MRLCVKKCAVLLLLCVIAFPCRAKESKNATPSPYTDDEFPQFMKDLRRAEIISFGALPFVTLTSTIVYSSARYAQHGFDSEYFPNFFAKASASNGYSTAEQAGILLIIGLDTSFPDTIPAAPDINALARAGPLPISFPNKNSINVYFVNKINP